MPEEVRQENQHDTAERTSGQARPMRLVGIAQPNITPATEHSDLIEVHLDLSG
jgi:hypothetical protein